MACPTRSERWQTRMSTARSSSLPRPREAPDRTYADGAGLRGGVGECRRETLVLLDHLLHRPIDRRERIDDADAQRQYRPSDVTSLCCAEDAGLDAVGDRTFDQVDHLIDLLHDELAVGFVEPPVLAPRNMRSLAR